MPRYRVTAEVVYYVDAPDVDAVYQHADDTDLIDVALLEVHVRTVAEDPR